MIRSLQQGLNVMRNFLAAVFIIAATPLMANDLARLEEATEATARQLNAFFVSRVPDLAPTIPSVEWDARFRNAGRCFLNEMRAAHGPEGVEAYLNDLENWSQTKITSMSQLGRMPARLRSDVAQSAARICKTVELATFRMHQSGMLEVLKDPAVIEKLNN